MPTKRKKYSKKISVFKPCKKQDYQVIQGIESHQNETLKKESKRKKWSEESRQKAIIFGISMGLSKATRYLQQSEEFKQLRTSTLYYWIKSLETPSVI